LDSYHEGNTEDEDNGYIVLPFHFYHKIAAVPFPQRAMLTNLTHGKSSVSISALAAGENNPVFVCRGLFEPRPALSLPTQNL
jgi:hypothetical protein